MYTRYTIYPGVYEYDDITYLYDKRRDGQKKKKRPAAINP